MVDLFGKGMLGSWPVFVRSGKYTTISVTEKKVVIGIMLLLCCCFTYTVNIYGHVGTVS